MATSNSRLAYSDAYDILDRALVSPLGLRLTFPSEGAARHYIQRLNKARVKNREDNAETYAEDQPLHGASAYDILHIKLRSNGEGTYVLIEKIDLEMKVEEIEE